LEKTKFLVIIVTVTILLSVLSCVSFTHLAFAQDLSLDKTSKNTHATNSGVTGASRQFATSSPSIRLSPNHGPPGTAFYIYGTGFPHVVDIAIMSPSSWKIPKIFTNTDGFFVDEGVVPADAAPGDYTVEASAPIGSGSADATFTVTGKVSDSHTPPPKPPVQAPKPPTDTTTSTATGGGSELPYIILDPTSGYPGTVVKIKGGNFVGDVTLSVGGKVATKSSDTNMNGDSVTTQADGSLSGVVTIPESAPPGPRRAWRSLRRRVSPSRLRSEMPVPACAAMLPCNTSGARVQSP